MKEFADNNSKFDENGRMFSRRVENTVGKGEIARYEVFAIDLKCRNVKTKLVWESVKKIKAPVLLTIPENYLCPALYLESAATSDWLSRV